MGTKSQIENNKCYDANTDLMITFESLSSHVRVSLLSLFFVGIQILGIPLLYYSIEEKLTVELRRVYNINYSFNYRDVRNYFSDTASLILGYILCGFVVSYTIKELYDFIVQTNSGAKELTSIAFTSLALCFAVRYNTRKHGYEKGKQILSLLFTAASIVFMVNVFVGTNELYLRNINESTPFIHFFRLYFMDLSISYISRVRELIFLVTDSWKIIILGSFIASVFGEIILTNSHNLFKYNFKNIYGFIPPDGPGYELVPYYKLTSKMQKMTKDGNFTSIRISSHTLKTFEIMRRNLEMHIENTKSPNIMVIAPKLQFIQYRDTLISYLFNNGLSKRDELKGIKYISNLEDLSFLAKLNIVKWVNKDFEEFRTIIVDDNKCLLIIDSLDMSSRKVGLYTENMDLISHFIHIFDKNFSYITNTNV